MDDLVTFLRARLDEDEAAAKAAGGWIGTAGFEQKGWIIVDRPEAQSAERAESRHMERHNPVRVLREVEAKRRILTEHAGLDFASLEEESRYRSFIACRRCRDILTDKRVVAPCPTLRLLALPYADHPHYRPEWAPQ